MVSKFTEELLKSALKAGADQSFTGTASRVDAELREVREVLASVNEEWMKPHEFEKSIGLECANAVECDQCDLTQRARDLMERLRER